MGMEKLELYFLAGLGAKKLGLENKLSEAFGVILEELSSKYREPSGIYKGLVTGLYSQDYDMLEYSFNIAEILFMTNPNAAEVRQLFYEIESLFNKTNSKIVKQLSAMAIVTAQAFSASDIRTGLPTVEYWDNLLYALQVPTIINRKTIAYVEYARSVLHSIGIDEAKMNLRQYLLGFYRR